MIQIIDKVTNPETLKSAIGRFRERGIILPTFEQLRNPELIPGKIKNKLKTIGLIDLDSMNSFRIT